MIHIQVPTLKRNQPASQIKYQSLIGLQSSVLLNNKWKTKTSSNIFLASSQDGDRVTN